MSLIYDPDDLTDTQEIVIDTTSGVIQLVKTGKLSDDGVTIKCVYSKLKELWKDNTTYIKHAFPMIPITDEQFEVVNGWDWADDTTKYLLRTGGWALKSVAGDTEEEWAGIVGLGSIGESDQVYCQQSSGGAAMNFQLTGQVNQAIQIFGDTAHGNFDYRDYLKLFCREWQKTYAFSQLSDIGVTTMSYQAYRFPLANTADVKVTHTENEVDTLIPYTNMEIEWFVAAQQRDIGGTNYDFHIIVDGANGTAEQIYEFAQRQLRKDTDIDAGTGDKIGKVTQSLLKFVGDTLYTMLLAEGGTFIDNYQAADINRLVFVDDTGTERVFPYVAVITINFGDNLKNDSAAKYWVYFTDLPGDLDYGTDDAVLVDDADLVDIMGTISGVAYVQRTFDYDNNEQGGRTKATDAEITAVAIGLITGQFVKATATIVKSIANSVSLVAPLERNYSNP